MQIDKNMYKSCKYGINDKTKQQEQFDGHPKVGMIIT